MKEYIIVFFNDRNEMRYVSSLYKNSVNYDADRDAAMKFKSLEQAKAVLSYCEEKSSQKYKVYSVEIVVSKVED